MDLLALEGGAALLVQLLDGLLLVKVLPVTGLPILTLELLILMVFLGDLIIYSNQSAPFRLWKVCKNDKNNKFTSVW